MGVVVFSFCGFRGDLPVFLGYGCYTEDIISDDERGANSRSLLLYGGYDYFILGFISSRETETLEEDLAPSRL